MFNELDKKNSLTLGVVSNWASHVVFLVSGFFLPRMIDRRLGQDVLGVWDFAWSLTAYTQLLALGISSAISRNVARCRESRDAEGLVRAYSTALTLLSLSGVLGTGLIVLGVFWTPSLINTTDPNLTSLAQRLVAILGASAVIQLPMGVYAGILSGCRRFELRTTFRVVCGGIGLILMLSALAMGRGLEWVATIYLGSELVIGWQNRRAGLRLCPGLRLDPGQVSIASIREVVGLGGKTVVQSLSRVTLYEASGLIVSKFLNPAAMAVYSRPRAITSFLAKLMNVYGNVFTPEAGALQASKDHEGLKALVIKTSRFGFAIILPFVVVLSLAGGPVLRLWMGPSYEARTVLAILMVGHLLSHAQRGTFGVLTGLNQHGLAALWELGAAILSIGIGLLFVVVFEWGLVGAATAVALAVTVGGGLAPAVLACRAVGLSLSDYARQVMILPMIAVTPLGVALLICGWMFADRPYLHLIVGLAVGGLLTAPIYWRYILTDSLRQRIRGRFRRIAQHLGRMQPFVGR